MPAWPGSPRSTVQQWLHARRPPVDDCCWTQRLRPSSMSAACSSLCSLLRRNCLNLLTYLLRQRGDMTTKAASWSDADTVHMLYTRVDAEAELAACWITWLGEPMNVEVRTSTLMKTETATNVESTGLDDESREPSRRVSRSHDNNWHTHTHTHTMITWSASRLYPIKWTHDVTLRVRFCLDLSAIVLYIG